MCKPNLFIPGFAKSGTSSLHAMLIQHPEIQGGNKKEPHTYSRNYLYENRFSDSKLGSFRRLYGDKTEKYILDSSTSYSVYPTAVKRIKKETPTAKFIVLCRDPIERIVSHYNWLVTKGLVNKPFKEEILSHGLNEFNPDHHYNGGYKNYIIFSSYGKHLQRLNNLFGTNSVFVVKFEELFDDWNNISKKLWKFLQLKESSVKYKHKNKTAINEENKDPSFLTRILGRIKKEYKIIANDIPRSRRVQNPISKTIDIDSIRCEFLMEYLKDDIDQFVSLGHDLKRWETTKTLYKKL